MYPNRFQEGIYTVEHSILLDKLYNYGIRGNALQWFNSYLTNRYQYVKYSNTPSDMKKITCGVPQGSILGPLLILLYIDGIASVSNILSSILFADDTTLFCSSKNLQELTAIVNNELGNVMQWLNANRLSLNIDKTNFTLFRPKGKNEICPNIHICGANIIEVDSAKFLGIIIDNRLNWVEHVKCISRKIAKGIGIIIKVRKSFESETLLNLYNALIFPYISYGIEVWGTAAALHLHRLHVLQIKIIRIICGVHPRTHTDPLFKLLGILNIDKTRDYSEGLIMYKFQKCMLPPLFEDMFIQTSAVHNYSTRQAGSLYVQYAPTKRTQRNLRHYGTKLWNSLHDVACSGCAISTFKQKFESISFVIIFCSFDCSFFFFTFVIFQTVCTLHITFQLLCTLHIAPCHSSPDNDENAVEMNLGHISSTSAPILQYVFLFVCFDMNTMYSILKGFSLYKFGNKFVFIVIVIVIPLTKASDAKLWCFFLSAPE